MVDAGRPRSPPCAAPRGPQNSPKTALSHKIQSLRDRKFKFCNRASLRKGSYMVEAGRPRPPPCPAPRGPLDSPKTALSHKIQSLPDRMFKFCSRASLGKGSCMVEAGRPRSPPCATPWGPQNSPKTALSHKIQSLQDRKYKFCSKTSLGKASFMVDAGRPWSPPCAAPWGPRNSPKTALSHKIQS